MQPLIILESIHTLTCFTILLTSDVHLSIVHQNIVRYYDLVQKLSSNLNGCHSLLSVHVVNVLLCVFFESLEQ